MTLSGNKIMNVFKNKENGFTLLEVLIALIVVTIAFGAFYASLTAMTRNQSVIIEKSLAAWTADNILTKLRIDKIHFPQNTHRLSGQENMGTSVYRYTIEKESTPDVHVDRYVVSIFDLNHQKITDSVGLLENEVDNHEQTQ